MGRRGGDFKLVEGAVQIERLLAFYAKRHAIPSRIVAKYTDDVELLFHTHPGDEVAVPSAPDIRHFIDSKQQIELIAASEEIIILEKTRNTPKEITLEAIDVPYGDILKKAKDMRAAQPLLLKWLDARLKIRSTIIPYTKEKTVLDLNIIRNIQ